MPHKIIPAIQCRPVQTQLKKLQNQRYLQFGLMLLFGLISFLMAFSYDHKQPANNSSLFTVSCFLSVVAMLWFAYLTSVSSMKVQNALRHNRKRGFNLFAGDIELCIKCADEENEPLAQYSVGRAYAHGQQLEGSSSKALAYLSLAVKNDVADAATEIALIYLHGSPEVRDHELFQSWLAHAVKMKSKEAKKIQRKYFGAIFLPETDLQFLLDQVETTIRFTQSKYKDVVC